MASHQLIISNIRFDYGDTVRVKAQASSLSRSGQLASVCGIRIVDSDVTSKQFNSPIGSSIYLIEFNDGFTTEIPEQQIERFSESEVSEHNLRQLSRISERLDMFEKGKISLGVLIGDIEFLLGALEAVEHHIRQSLHEQWSILEEIYSVAKVMKVGHLSSDDESAIRNSIKILSAQVSEVVGAKREL